MTNTATLILKYVTEVMIVAYTIGQAAQKANLSPSTLRYYDKEGLLPFLSRSESGIRMFNDTDLEILTIIDCLKKTSMPIKEIKNFMELAAQGDGTISERLTLIRQRKMTVQKQMEQLQQTLAILDYKIWYYETAAKAGSSKIHESYSTEDIPEKHRNIYKKLKGK